MPIFRAALARLFKCTNTTTKVRLSFSADQNIARYAEPLIDRLLADDDDGRCYRLALREWSHAERPVIETHHGTTSWLRIDGPHYGEHGFALGALLQSPGVTAHLNPAETHVIRERIAEMIEQAILDWIEEFCLQEQLPVEAGLNRAEADPLAKAIIRKYQTPEGLKAACVQRFPLLSYRGEHHG